MLYAAAKAASVGTSNLTIALISAGAAILGAVVGGALTAYATYRIEQSRQKHDFDLEEKRQTHVRELEDKGVQRALEQEHRALLGTTRMLSDYLLKASATFEASLKTEIWWPRIAGIDPPPPDRERVLSLLTAEEWLTLSQAAVAIEHLTIIREINVGSAEPEPRVALDEGDKEVLRKGKERVDLATKALERLASGVPAGVGRLGRV